MKKLFVILFMSGASLTFVKSQVIVNSSGHTGIGADPYPAYFFRVNGTSIFENELTLKYTSFPHTTLFINDIGPEVKPYLADMAGVWCGNLGTSDYPWSYIYYENLVNRSDFRSKENVREVDSSIHKIMLLHPVKYDYKKEYFADLSAYPELSRFSHPEDRFNRVGLVAQETETVIPSVVKYDKENDIYGIDYVALVPYLIGAIQEQQAQIETLKNIMISQEQELIKIKDFIGYSEGGVRKSASSEPEADLMAGEFPVLYQNTPNPFYDKTQIKVFLPEGVRSAKLYVHSLNGTEVMVRNLSGLGELMVIIDGATLQKGMYLYTLEVDGKMVDTKRMILTE